MGSKSKYNPNMCQEAIWFLGLPDRPTMYGLADYLGITYPTFCSWRREYPDFNEAVKKGLDLREKNYQVPRQKYTKDTPRQVMGLFARGKSVGAVCASLGITNETYIKWQKDYPEFKEAVELGKMLEQEHWEQIGYEAMLGKIKDFNSQVWSLTVKNRFNYKEKTELSGDQDSPLSVNVNFVSHENKDEDE